MKASEIKVGEVYSARVSGNVVRVRVDEIRRINRTISPGYGMGCRPAKFRESTVYDVTNLVTGRKVVFKSAAKFRGRALGSGRVATKVRPDDINARLAAGKTALPQLDELFGGQTLAKILPGTAQ